MQNEDDAVNNAFVPFSFLSFFIAHQVESVTFWGGGSFEIEAYLTLFFLLTFFRFFFYVIFYSIPSIYLFWYQFPILSFSKLPLLSSLSFLNKFCISFLTTSIWWQLAVSVQVKFCKTSGFHSSDYEECRILRCGAV
jgi:hypothetical protein